MFLENRCQILKYVCHGFSTRRSRISWSEGRTNSPHAGGIWLCWHSKSFSQNGTVGKLDRAMVSAFIEPIFHSDQDIMFFFLNQQDICKWLTRLLPVIPCQSSEKLPPWSTYHEKTHPPEKHLSIWTMVRSQQKLWVLFFLSHRGEWIENSIFASLFWVAELAIWSLWETERRSETMNWHRSLHSCEIPVIRWKGSIPTKFDAFYLS